MTHLQIKPVYTRLSDGKKSGNLMLEGSNYFAD